jgi:uncharacterized protein (DUF427 family)
MVTPDPKRPGQESVWDYPRPPRLEASSRRLRIVHRGQVVADTVRGFRTLETSHPPTWYFPPGDVAMALLSRSPQRGTLCEWKGRATYWDVTVAGETLAAVAWSYAAPTPGFAALADHLAFYAAPFDEVTVDGERVVPQPGGFYGGWITSDLAGPFKGVPGSQFW